MKRLGEQQYRKLFYDKKVKTNKNNRCNTTSAFFALPIDSIILNCSAITYIFLLLISGPPIVEDHESEGVVNTPLWHLVPLFKTRRDFLAMCDQCV